MTGPLAGRFRTRLHPVSIGDHREAVDEDVRRYVAQRLGNPGVQAAVTGSETDAIAFAERCVGAAHGNFLYATALLDTLELALERGQDAQVNEILALQALPNELDDLYAYLLDSIRRGLADTIVERPGRGLLDAPIRVSAWSGVYQPLLSILSVAREPLTRRQIARYVGTEENDRHVIEALARMRAILVLLEGRYALYHTTLAEFVSATRTAERHPELHVEPREGHLAIARSYRSDKTRWSEVDWDQADDYGLLHLSAHLAELASSGDDRKVYARELDGLLCRSFMEAKRSRYASHLPFDADVLMSVSVAQSATCGRIRCLRAAGALPARANQVTNGARAPWCPVCPGAGWGGHSCSRARRSASCSRADTVLCPHRRCADAVRRAR